MIIDTTECVLELKPILKVTCSVCFGIADTSKRYISHLYSIARNINVTCSRYDCADPDLVFRNTKYANTAVNYMINVCLKK